MSERFQGAEVGVGGVDVFRIEDVGVENPGEDGLGIRG